LGQIDGDSGGGGGTYGGVAGIDLPHEKGFPLQNDCEQLPSL
jgi:hypothetical protein